MAAPRNGDTLGGQYRIWVTSVADRLDHAVTPEAMEAARTAGQRPVAACGAHLLSAALCAPPWMPLVHLGGLHEFSLRS